MYNTDGTFRGGGANTTGTLNLVGASDPVVVRDGTGTSSPPMVQQFIDLPNEQSRCPASTGRIAAWPQSVAAIPDQDTSKDLLAVFFQAFCVQPNSIYQALDVGVGFVVYDPANPGAVLRITTQNPALYRYPLFSGTYQWTSSPYPDFGYAWGAIVRNGYLTVNQCGQSPGPGQFKCSAKRVALVGNNGLLDLVAIGTPGNYSDLLEDGSWGTASASSPPRNLADPSGLHSGDPAYQVNGGAAITRINALDRYIIIYKTPSGSFVARSATSPAGAWSDPIELDIPDTQCSGPFSPYGCYQPVVQEAMYVGSSRTIGFTYYDPGLQTVPGHLLLTAPWDPTPYESYGAMRAASFPASALGL
jgi:hypothetical protein